MDAARPSSSNMKSIWSISWTDVMKLPYISRVQLTFLLTLAFMTVCSAQDSSDYSNPLPRYKNGKWGYVDSKGKFAIECRFDAARPFVGDLAQVAMVDAELPEIDNRPNLKWGY